MGNAIIKLFGIKAAALFGDAAVFDRFRWLKKNLRKGSLRTLDAGCGSGAFSLYAASMGNEVVGISFQEENNRTASARAELLRLQNAKFITGDLRKLDAMVGTLGLFDQIICFETIEHIKDDAKLLRDFARLLKPRGRVLLTAPYKHYRRLPGDSISAVENGDHVRWGYTHDELKDLFAAAGLDIIVADYVTGFIPQKLIALERWFGRFLPAKLAWLAVFPFRALRALDRFVTGYLSYPYLSVVVVARKNNL